MSGWADLAGWERRRAGTDCEVCRSKGNALAHLEASWILIGPDDPMPGYVCLVFGRHAVELHDLTDAEGTAFMRDIRKVSAAVAAIVHPLKMNYEIHGNTAPHLHVHFFPRHSGDQFAGGPIDPRAARRPAYAPGEFDRFRERLRAALGSMAWPEAAMRPQPELETERLLLRAFRPEDAAVVQRLAGEREVADTTLTIPHPYLDGMAESWIATHAEAWERQERLTLAMTAAQLGVIGAISLHLRPVHRRAELGYWVGRPFWNRGFATEAARAVIAFGFEALGLNRIHASHLTRNPASGRVMAKAGMRLEGTFRQHVIKWDRPEDLTQYSILRTDLPRG